MEKESTFLFVPFFRYKWLVVHRARPFDNPNIDRSANLVLIYKSEKYPKPQKELRNVRIELTEDNSDDPQDPHVVFVLLATMDCRTGADNKTVAGAEGIPSGTTLRFKCRPDVFNWLVNALSDDFGHGQGPMYGPGGEVILPLTNERQPVPCAQIRSQALGYPSAYNAVGPRRRTPESNRQRAPTGISQPATTGATTSQSAPQTSPSTELGRKIAMITNRMPGISFPDRFLCPITHDVMQDPVVAADGHTYERSAIAQWFQHHFSSPKTNERLDTVQLIPNHLIRSEILQWIDDKLEEIRASEAYDHQTGCHPEDRIQGAPSAEESSTGATYGYRHEDPPQPNAPPLDSDSDEEDLALTHGPVLTPNKSTYSHGFSHQQVDHVEPKTMYPRFDASEYQSGGAVTNMGPKITSTASSPQAVPRNESLAPTLTTGRLSSQRSEATSGVNELSTSLQPPAPSSRSDSLISSAATDSVSSAANPVASNRVTTAAIGTTTISSEGSQLRDTSGTSENGEATEVVSSQESVALNSTTTSAVAMGNTSAPVSSATEVEDSSCSDSQSTTFESTTEKPASSTTNNEESSQIWNTLPDAPTHVPVPPPRSIQKEQQPAWI